MCIICIVFFKRLHAFKLAVLIIQKMYMKKKKIPPPPFFFLVRTGTNTFPPPPTRKRENLVKNKGNITHNSLPRGKNVTAWCFLNYYHDY